MAYTPSLYNPYGVQFPYTSPQFQQPTDGLVWIDGIEGANMYPLPPNSTSPVLMFKNEPRFAIKTTDAGGAGSVKTFSFEEDVPEPEPEPEQYATLGQLESALDRMKSEILEAINAEPAVQTKKPRQ